LSSSTNVLAYAITVVGAGFLGLAGAVTFLFWAEQSGK
jgi:hypothetical protein